MKAKDYFIQIAQYEEAIRMLQAKIQHYEDIGIAGSRPSGGSGHASGSSRVESAAVAMADATEALRRQIRDYKRKTDEAEALIARIPQPNYRKILTLRYICGWSLRSISDEMRYTDQRSIYRAHGWALAEAQKILNEE